MSKEDLFGKIGDFINKSTQSLKDRLTLDVTDLIRGIDDNNPEEVERALSTLTQREAEVVRLYFGIHVEHSLTLEEIGEKFDLTRERVRQIKEKAIRRLRHTSRSVRLKSYLG